jgi:hypothetical protein
MEARKRAETGKNDEEAESAHPENGQDKKEGSQAKANFHELNTSSQEMSFKRKPRTGGNSRMGNISPLPQNLQMRGSSSEPIIFLNQSRNFNFRMMGN